jgi:hypothetical protein
MDFLATADAVKWLAQSGWSAVESAVASGTGRTTWTVEATKGQNVVRARGRSRADAWQRALEKARDLGRRFAGS